MYENASSLYQQFCSLFPRFFTEKKKKYNYTSDVCHSVQWRFLLGEKANPLLLCPCLCSQQLIIVRGPLVIVLPVPHHSRQPLAHQGLRDVAARKAVGDDVSSCVIIMMAMIMKIIHTPPPGHTHTGWKLFPVQTLAYPLHKCYALYDYLSVIYCCHNEICVQAWTVCVCVCVCKTFVYV